MTKRHESRTRLAFLATGDFDGNGSIDIAIPNPTNHTLSVLMDQGSGLMTTVLPVGINPTSVAVDDLNDDGRDDIAVGNRASDTVSIVLATETSFADHVEYDVDGSPVGLALGDVDQDGNTDFVVANDSSSVTVWLGDGLGAFDGREDYSLEADEGEFSHGVNRPRPVDLALADIDFDVFLDAITANEFSESLTLLMSEGDGSFGSPLTVDGGRSPNALTVGMVDEDATPDIVVAQSGDDVVNILYGNGDGSFDSYDILESRNFGASYETLDAGDLDGDDVKDLIVSDNEFTEILISDGAGGVLKTQTVLGEKAQLRDVDGDSDLDLIGYYDNDLITYLNDGQGNFGTFLGVTNGDFGDPPLDEGDGLPFGPIPGWELVDLNSAFPAPNDSAYGLFNPGDDIGNIAFLYSEYAADDNKPFALEQQLSDTLEPDKLYVLSVDVSSYHEPGYRVELLANGVELNSEDGMLYSDNPTKTVLLPFYSNDSHPVGEAFTIRLWNLGQSDGPNEVDYDNVRLSVLPFTSMPQMHDFAFADVNGDDAADLVGTGGEAADPKIFVSLGNGDGSFASFEEYNGPSSTADIQVDDFDGDGNIDLALARTGNDVEIYLGDGTGSFSPDSTLTPLNGYEFAFTFLVADWNDDATPDILVGSNSGIHIMQGNGDGSFAEVHYVSLASPADEIKIDDINDDGALDIVSVSSFDVTSVSVLLGLGDGSLDGDLRLFIGINPTGLEILDLDDDDDLDLVTLGNNEYLSDDARSIRVLFNRKN